MSAAKRLERLEGFGERLAVFRQNDGMTQAELAEAVGVSVSTVGHIETGRTLPSVSLLVKLSRVLYRTTDELVGLYP